MNGKGADGSNKANILFTISLVTVGQYMGMLECLASPPYIDFLVYSAISRRSSSRHITSQRAHRESKWMLCSKHQNFKYRMNFTADVWLSLNGAQLRHKFEESYLRGFLETSGHTWTTRDMSMLLPYLRTQWTGHFKRIKETKP